MVGQTDRKIFLQVYYFNSSLCYAFFDLKHIFVYELSSDPMSYVSEFINRRKYIRTYLVIKLGKHNTLLKKM